MTDTPTSARARLRMGVERMVEEREAQIVLDALNREMDSARWHGAKDNVYIVDRAKPVHRDRAAVLSAFLGEQADG